MAVIFLFDFLASSDSRPFSTKRGHSIRGMVSLAYYNSVLAEIYSRSLILSQMYAAGSVNICIIGNLGARTFLKEDRLKQCAARSRPGLDEALHAASFWFSLHSDGPLSLVFIGGTASKCRIGSVTM